MLHRHDDVGLTLISQPAHAWISGQLAGHWGNADQGFDRASLELILAAGQHDIAWIDWETQPSLNPGTGLPYAFNQLPTSEHLEIWDTATVRALSYGQLPALLISMHGTYLYRRFHDFDTDSKEDAQLAREFLEREEAFQLNAMNSLEASCDISLEQVDSMRQHLSLWDALSLSLCMGFEESRTFDKVPSESGSLILRSISASDSVNDFEVEPWPFQTEDIELRCEGRLLDGTFSDQQAMREALVAAPARYLRFRLTPAVSNR